MTGSDEGSDWENKFYWSFYKISNGKIISLHSTENYKKNKLIDSELNFFYTKKELNNGKIITYDFGDAKANDEQDMSKEFFDWFEFLPPFHQIKNNIYPTEEELICVEEFYKKHVMNKKNEKTDTINIEI